MHTHLWLLKPHNIVYYSCYGIARFSLLHQQPCLCYHGRGKTQTEDSSHFYLKHYCTSSINARASILMMTTGPYCTASVCGVETQLHYKTGTHAHVLYRVGICAMQGEHHTEGPLGQFITKCEQSRSALREVSYFKATQLNFCSKRD